MSEGAFWAFSLGIYARPGVPAALLRWQDEGGADVDLVLYILWRAACGEVLTGADIGAADAAVAAWREEVVRPLRRARRALKTATPEGAQALRERVQADELDAERVQHALLERLPHAATRSAAADPAPALALYARRLELGWPGLQDTLKFLADPAPATA